MLSVAIICGTIAWMWWETLKLGERLWTNWHTMELEYKFNPPTTPVPQVPKRDPMPLHILSYAQQWEGTWAKEDALKRAEELYDTYGDWDKVASVMAPRKDA